MKKSPWSSKSSLASWFVEIASHLARTASWSAHKCQILDIYGMLILKDEHAIDVLKSGNTGHLWHDFHAIGVHATDVGHPQKAKHLQWHYTLGKRRRKIVVFLSLRLLVGQPVCTFKYQTVVSQARSVSLLSAKFGIFVEWVSRHLWQTFDRHLHIEYSWNKAHLWWTYHLQDNISGS